MQIIIHNKHKVIYKYIQQKQIKSQQVNLFQKCSEYYEICSNRILFITHDDSSPTESCHMDTSTVMLLPYTIATEG